MLKFDESARTTFEEVLRAVNDLTVGTFTEDFIPKMEDLRNPGTHQSFNVLQAFEGSDLRKKREMMRK